MPRPRRRLLSARTWVWLGLFTLIALRVLTLSRAQGQRNFSVAPLREGPCQVVRVISGDTLVIRQDPLPDEVVVRLLSTQAITDQENPSLAAQARRFTSSFLASGDVSLRMDNHRLDERGQYLAYVECGSQQLNEALVAAGLARFTYLAGNSASMDRRLKDAQESARLAKLGMHQ